MPALPLDEGDLANRLSAIVPDNEIGPIAELEGGTSSLTYWTTLDGEKVVLKIAVPGLDPVRNRDVLRQARLLKALAPTPVPVPRVIAEHEGAPPEIPPFFVMSFEDGICIEPNSLTGEAALPADEVRARELTAVTYMGQLHAVDPVTVGLGDEPEGTLDGEVQRWKNSFEVCEEDLQIGSQDVYDLLMANIPEAGPTVLLHGDFRLGNTLSLDSRVTAVIDWEIWSRGDARIDLAWFLLMANPEPELGGSSIAAGMPGNDELISTYQTARGVEVSDLRWFEALVRFKQAAAGAFITRNARRRGVASPVGDDAGENPRLTSARAMLSE
jgi:aminoglycoside phosphotransferase (APT) family kinase protein